jgi:hypothetical protein
LKVMHREHLNYGKNMNRTEIRLDGLAVFLILTLLVLGLGRHQKMPLPHLHTHKVAGRHIAICNPIVPQFVGTELHDEQVWR